MNVSMVLILSDVTILLTETLCGLFPGVVDAESSWGRAVLTSDSITPAQIAFDANTIIVVAVLLLILGFVFFVYLLLRRTAKGFKEGMKQDR